MKRLQILLTALIVINFSACKQSTEPAPPDQNPQGYQEDIPWPSLADSPWPAWHHDMQSTGRTPLSFPNAANTIESVQINYTEGDIVCGKNGTLFFLDGGNPSVLKAYSLTDGVIWSKSVGYFLPANSPLLLKDNKIIVSSDTKETFLISLDSTIVWKYKNDGINYNRRIGVDLEGNFYFVESPHNLVVLSPEGKLLWQLNDENILGGINQVPVFSPDGKTVYLEGSNSAVVAIDIKMRTIKWSYGSQITRNVPVVTNEGYLIITEPADDGVSQLTLLTPEGTVKWHYKLNYLHIGNVEPAIDYKGNIYCGTDTLYSINLEGKANWEKALPEDLMRISPIITDANNKFCFSASNGEATNNYVFCFSPEGNILWKVKLEANHGLSSPAVVDNGIIAVPTFNSDKIYIIK